MATLTGLPFARQLSIIRRDRVALSVWGTAVGSWATIFLWTESPYSVYLGHSDLGGVFAAAQFLPLASFFLLGWSLMVLAMMLPSALPLVNEYRRRMAGTPVRRSLTTSLIAGAVGVWVPFGIAMYFLDLGIHRASELPPLQGNVWVLGFSSLALAGTYQFTRRKYEFLTDCCYPSDLLQAHSHENLTEGGAFRTGLSYGKASMGSHWALMLLMFSLALRSFPLMLLLSSAMAVEHESKLGPRVRLPLGVAILVLAVYLGTVGLGT